MEDEARLAVEGMFPVNLGVEEGEEATQGGMGLGRNKLGEDELGETEVCRVVEVRPGEPRPRVEGITGLTQL